VKIVNRKTFLQMPEGTLYSKYAPCYFENFEIKGETLLTDDFCSQGLIDCIRCEDSGEFVTILHDSEVNGASFSLDFDCYGRDGSFDDDQLFAVWERADVDALIERLKQVKCVS